MVNVEVNVVNVEVNVVWDKFLSSPLTVRTIQEGSATWLQ